MRARSRHRAPVPDTESILIWCGLLLIITFGIALAATHEAYLAGDHSWMTFFGLATGVDVGLYAWVVQGWIQWIALEDEYSLVDHEVAWRDEDRRHDDNPAQD